MTLPGRQARLTKAVLAVLARDGGVCSLCGEPWDYSEHASYVLFDGDVAVWYRRPGEPWRIGCAGCVVRAA